MKMIYAIGTALALSGVAFAGETETKMMKEMVKDAVKKEMSPQAAVPPVVPTSEEVSDEELLMIDEDMTPEEMEEEAKLLIAEGEALKKRAAEIRAKEKMKKSDAATAGGAPKK